ncbi:hypothetical protein [Natronobacterium texcoconense]|uniref:Uncharacterized protein n=1 Tax=Natronobacterium texcoconense TaxID=1095778 RepID=A0A1H1HSV9_NATTX|nr:hypothetical protein [Natronobacterium texcoconense]SDR28484.1 hypothetical protein SAMN04489842_3017 [Natronobacterium texcoconense]
MTDDREIDVDALEAELEQIKDAMGIHERYPTQFQLWLVYGLLTMLASFGSQAVVTYDLPGWGHAASWGGFMGAGILYSWYVGGDYEEPEDTTTKPDLTVQSMSIVAYLLAVLFIVTPLLSDASPLVESATIFALIIGAVAASYVVTGASLKSYYVRARDRYAFYAGGVWILVYAVAMVHVPPLQEWGYAIFGVLYAVYGVTAYVYLARDTDTA